MRRPRDRAHSATATEDITDMAENARTLLHRLARAHGVQTRYTGQDGSEQSVGDETLIRVLAALGVGVDARGVAGLTTALEDAELAPWRRTLPPTVAVRRGHRLPTGRFSEEHHVGLEDPAAEPAGRVAEVRGAIHLRIAVGRLCRIGRELGQAGGELGIHRQHPMMQ